MNKGWKTLIGFTAGDNPKVKGIKAEEISDESAMRELDESGFVKSFGLIMSCDKTIRYRSDSYSSSKSETTAALRPKTSHPS